MIDQSTLEVAHRMANNLIAHCIEHGINVRVELGEDEAANCEAANCCADNLHYRRRTLTQILAAVNERICVISGAESDTMDARLNMMFDEVVNTLLPE